MKFTTLLGAVSIAALGSSLAAQDAELLVFDYSGFEVPEHHAAYIAKHGQSPSFAFFGDEDEAFQKIRSGFQADVAHICAGSVTKWQDSGLLEAWDTAKIQYYADLDANLKGQEIGAGQTYFVPTDFGSTAIAYNPDEVSADDVATLQVFKNPKYAGRMSLPDNVDDAYALAYLATGVTNWTEATDEQFEAASAWLREIHPNLRTYWTDAGELAQLMASGEILVSWAWNETYPTMVEEGRPIAFQREATEGSSLWLCGYVNLANSPGNADKAYDYLNAFLAPDNVMPLLENGYGSANATALNDQVGVEDLAAAGLEPITAPVLAQLPMSNASRERQVETFELIKAGF
ncbi:MAG: extracellular solute-binding protein [Loktanella sp.]|jgi:spermidine/putrescine transport system substrate-binding protein|nr:extracellular solute-binding protein [Loktanella sp.]MDO7608153.1 extracellular solute-binding protein [Loktanella sp.]MDO7624412.1 extracellular solute-binding protein [Loktanella sp.]MDO7626692.1 extracellular solute-binding protein [Loktanella sp.]MDO7629777.1 extracellular solute-binding protein [Loktanella sp.]